MVKRWVSSSISSRVARSIRIVSCRTWRMLVKVVSRLAAVPISRVMQCNASNSSPSVVGRLFSVNTSLIVYLPRSRVSSTLRCLAGCLHLFSNPASIPSSISLPNNEVAIFTPPLII